MNPSDPTSRSRQTRLDDLIHSLLPLVQTADPEKLVGSILASAARLFETEACSLGLVDRKKKQITFSKMEGTAKTDEFTVRLDQGIAGWVASHGEGVVCNDVMNDPRFFGGVDRKSGYTTRSLLTVPIIRDNATVAVLQAMNTRRPGGFSDDDLEALTAFAELVKVVLDRAHEITAVKQSHAVLHETVQDRYRLVAGDSPAMKEALSVAEMAARAPSTILLLGESGTGKEVVARAIHHWSERRDHPFVAVNCAALAADLLESELFGHEKGAFTGAIGRKKGRFEIAGQGTLFLDEIGELPAQLQAKLLRVLQEKEFQRVGGVQDIRADCRIIAATNQNLKQSCEDGTFREDLYFRLNVVSIPLPPLRDRGKDIITLALHFLERYCKEMNRAQLSLETETIALIQSYRWPGNVRELQNAMERAVVLTAAPIVAPANLPPDIRGEGPPTRKSDPMEGIDPGSSLTEAVDEFKRIRIRAALNVSGGNQTQAAKMLGLRQPNLSRLIKSLGL